MAEYNMTGPVLGVDLEIPAFTRRWRISGVVSGFRQDIKHGIGGVFKQCLEIRSKHLDAQVRRMIDEPVFHVRLRNPSKTVY